MRPMMLGILVSVFACGEFFILESNTQDDANHAPMLKPVGVAGLEFSTRTIRSKEGTFSVVVVAKNPGKARGKKVCRILLQETKMYTMSRMMPTPQVVWSREVEIELEAGEEKTFTFSDPRLASLEVIKPSDPRVASMKFPNTEVLAELVVLCGKERASILPSAAGIPARPVIELPKKIEKELDSLSKGN